MENKPVHINKWLLPFSWLYGFIVFLRNKLFDWKILKQVEFKGVPVICVGNLTVGGTGKTPHVEYLIRLLQSKHRVAVLSRGYKRNTKGFILSTPESTSTQIGDEPYQIKQKFPQAIVAVDANRRRGIEILLELENPPEVIILDDAFQHRYVKASFNIILSNFNRPVYLDKLLPAGRLREPVKALRDASMVIMSKCPEDLLPIDYRILSHELSVLPYQGLFFTSFVYQKLKPVFSDYGNQMELSDLKNKTILLVTGIASPDAIISKLSQYTDKIEVMTYPDHYNFKKKDINKIESRFNNIADSNKIILVTEKDASRLVLRDDISDSVKNLLYYLPIEVRFLIDDSEKQFEEKILKHVKEISRNRRIHKK